MKEDMHSATLIHQDGHQLIIAKAPLSHLQRKQLEALTPHYDEGGEVAPASDEKLDIQPVNGVEYEPVDSTSPANQSSPSVGAPPQVQMPSAPQAPKAQVPSQPAVAPAQNMTQAQIPGYAEEQAANLALAKAQGEEGAKEAKAYDIAASQLKKLPTQQEIVNSYQKANQRLADAYAKKEIDPSHYWQDHSKVAAGIGLLLSGVGSAMGGNGPGAFEALQAGIARDIDAQKSNQEQAHNLWKMNMHALGNEMAANLATQNQLNLGLQYQINKAAAEAKTPQALAMQQIANARINQMVQGNNFKLSLLNPTSDNPDPASRVQFLVPEGARPKVNEEIAEAQNAVRNFDGANEAFWQAAKDARPLTGGLKTSARAVVPYLKTPGQQAFQGRIAPTIQTQEGTVRQTAFDNVDHNMTPQFGDSDEQIATKYKTFLDYMRSKASAPNAKTYGIDLTRYPSTNTLALGQQYQKNIPQALPTKGGHEYQRQIINGKPYMVPVK